MELANTKGLTIEVAKKLAEAAKTYAKRKGHPTLIVLIVDPGGHLVYLERGDGVGWGTINVALLKAQSAVQFNGPSKNLELALLNGHPGLAGLPGIACFEVAGQTPGKTVARLRAAGVVASTSPYVPTYARLSAGLLNDEAEVTKALAAVHALA